MSTVTGAPVKLSDRQQSLVDFYLERYKPTRHEVLTVEGRILFVGYRDKCKDAFVKLWIAPMR